MASSGVRPTRWRKERLTTAAPGIVVYAASEPRLGWMPVSAKKLGDVTTTVAVVLVAPNATSIGGAGVHVAVETISGTTRTVAARESLSQRLPPAANCTSVAGSAKGSGRKVVVVITLTTVATPTN